jgi:hypothetical protein
VQKMTEAIITIVNVKSEGNFSYPETRVLRVEFDSNEGAENLIEDLQNAGGKYGIVAIEDMDV